MEKDNTSFWLGVFLGLFFNIYGTLISICISKSGNDIMKGSALGLTIWMIIYYLFGKSINLGWIF